MYHAYLDKVKIYVLLFYFSVLPYLIVEVA